MTFRIICLECGYQLYTGYDLKSARDIIKAASGKCDKCNSVLSPHDFKIEVKNKYP